MTGAEVLVARVEHLVADLRVAAVPVRVSEVIDAMSAITHMDLTRREEVRAALCSTLVKRECDLPVFDVLFDTWFPAATQRAGSEPLRHRVVAAVADGDDPRLAELAKEAATHGDRRFQRMVRDLEAGTLARDALRQGRATGSGTTAASATTAVDRFLRALRKELLARQRLDERDEGAVPVTRPEDIDIAAATATELRELRAAVQPLARRLAARLRESRRDRRGVLDVRKTIRRSTSAGGVPIDTVWRRRRLQRPDLWLLCDVSGSVAEFARFTVGLVAATHDEVSNLHAYVFVDEIVDLTDTLSERLHDVDAFALVGAAAVQLAGAHSDWGQALRAFEHRHAAQIGTRSTVVITGDGRSHGADPGAEVIERLCRRARRVALMVPEPRHKWDTGDSALAQYASAGAALYEVQNLAQLSDALEHLVDR